MDSLTDSVRLGRIASVLVVPIAARIGSAMDVPHPRLLIFSTALICSAGMGLPISGFPNLQAINVEDDIGQRYLEPTDFFKNGIPSSVIAVGVVITVRLCSLFRDLTAGLLCLVTGWIWHHETDGIVNTKL